ncbi:MAG: TRAP transporter small permease subunit [Deltaproteobacteria bacterium]|nr:TRAP transporter small permease subunit [Deltaproteobacteria bacterium]
MSDYGVGIGQIGVFLIIVIIFFDVTGSKLLRKPIYGAGDMVGIIQLLAISIAIPLGLLKEVNPRVTFFVNLLGRRIRNVLSVSVNVLGILLFALLTGMTFRLAQQYQRTNELIGNIDFPLYPFIYIAGFCFAIGCIVWLLQCLISLRPEGRNV